VAAGGLKMDASRRKKPGAKRKRGRPINPLRRLMGCAPLKPRAPGRRPSPLTQLRNENVVLTILAMHVALGGGRGRMKVAKNEMARTWHLSPSTVSTIFKRTRLRDMSRTELRQRLRNSRPPATVASVTAGIDRMRSALQTAAHEIKAIRQDNYPRN
jgi:hypothetical protein